MKNLTSKILVAVFIAFAISVAVTRVEAAPDCNILSARFEPSGNRPDGWFKDDSPPTVKISVLGNEACKGKSAEVTLYQYNVGPTVDTRIPEFSNYLVTFNNASFTIEDTKVGETGCNSGAIGVDDCKYYLEVNGKSFEDQSSANLSFECDGMCKEKWVPGKVFQRPPDGPPPAPLELGYTLLSPLPCEKGTDNCDANGEFTKFDPTGDKENKLIGRYLNIMLRIFIGICAVAAVMMIVVGGLEYMTMDLVSSKEHARSRINGAILGLLLALGSWAILNQINPDLLKTDFSNLKKATAEIDLEADVPQTPINGKYPNGTPHGAPWPGTPVSVAGVNVSPPGDCQTVGQPHCTSTKGLNTTYLDKIKAGCPTCQLTVTGGTEFWLHGGKSGNTSHGKGSPTVDLRMDAALTAWIKSGKKETATGNRWNKDGISFLYENHSGVEHWHAGR